MTTVKLADYDLARLEFLHAQAEDEQAADDAGPDEVSTTARVEASQAILAAFPALAATMREQDRTIREQLIVIDAQAADLDCWLAALPRCNWEADRGRPQTCTRPATRADIGPYGNYYACDECSDGDGNVYSDVPQAALVRKARDRARAEPTLAAEVRRLAEENEELAAERDRAYHFLMRWQDWAKEIARARGWVPPDVLPDDTKTRDQIAAALAEHTVMKARLSVQHESDGLE